MLSSIPALMSFNRIHTHDHRNSPKRGRFSKRGRRFLLSRSPRHRLSLFLALFIAFLILARPASAEASILGSIVGLVAKPIGALLGGPVGWVLDKVGGALLAVVNAILEDLGSFVWEVSQIAARFFTWVLVVFNQQVGFANNDMVQQGWGVVRDVANWFFIVLLLISAISTILGIQRYHARSILPKLLILALLINFSLWITGFLINVAQVIMTTFVVNGAGPTGDIGLVLAQAMGMNELVTGAPIETGAQAVALAGHLIRIFFGLLVIFMFFFLAIMLIVRIVILWITMILSPLAFIGFTIPRMQQFSNEWLNRFVHWNVFGIFVSFFVWLATWLAAYLLDPNHQFTFSITEGQLASADTLSSGSTGFQLLVTSATYLMRFITIIIFMFMGYAVSKQLSGGAAQGVVKGMRSGLALGAGAATFGAAKGRLAAYRTQAVGRMGEALQRIPGARFLGAARVGRRAMEAQERANAERFAKAQGKIAHLTTPQLQAAARNARGLEGVAILQRLIERGVNLRNVEGLDDARIANLMQVARRVDQHRPIMVARPDLAVRAGLLTPHGRGENSLNTFLERMRPSEVARIQAAALEDEITARAVTGLFATGRWHTSHLSTLLASDNVEGQRAMTEHVLYHPTRGPHARTDIIQHYIDTSPQAYPIRAIRDRLS